MNDRTVVCARLGKNLPGLAKPPFKGEMGERIYNSISQRAWDEWKDMQIKVINEYRLNMGDPDDYQKLVEQMLTFLNLQEGEVVEVGNVVEGTQGE